MGTPKSPQKGDTSLKKVSVPETSSDVVDNDMMVDGSSADELSQGKDSRTKKRKIAEDKVSQKKLNKERKVQSKAEKGKSKQNSRHARAANAALNKLHGLGDREYDLYCYINDDVAAVTAGKDLRFSLQPLRIAETLLHIDLGIHSENREQTGMKINKFKKNKEDKFFTVEVKVSNEEQLGKLLSLSTIGNFKVKCSENLNKNCIKGTFRDFKDEFDGETDKEILEYFKTKGVQDIMKVERLGKSKTITVSFRGQDLPTRIELGVKHFDLKPFIDKPRRCFRCNSYEHSKFTCRNDYSCYRCGLQYKKTEEHTPKDCQEAPKCVHCKLEHMTGSGKCEVEKKEMKWKTLMVEMSITRRDAKIRYPTGEWEPFSVVASKSPPFSIPLNFSSQPVFPESSTDVRSASGDNVMSTLLQQNKEILSRFNRVETFIDRVEKDIPADNEEKPVSQDDNGLAELKAQIAELSRKQKATDAKVFRLENDIAKKDEMIRELEETVNTQSRTIAAQKFTLESCEALAAASDAQKELLDSNVKLKCDNDLLRKVKQNSDEKIKRVGENNEHLQQQVQKLQSELQAIREFKFSNTITHKAVPPDKINTNETLDHDP